MRMQRSEYLGRRTEARGEPGALCMNGEISLGGIGELFRPEKKKKGKSSWAVERVWTSVAERTGYLTTCGVDAGRAWSLEPVAAPLPGGCDWHWRDCAVSSVTMRWLVIVTALTRLALSVVLILAAVFCIVLADGPRVFTTECLLSNSLILMLSYPIST